MTLEITDRVKLILARVEILKLKADDYTWQCSTPATIKTQIDAALTEIDAMLAIPAGQQGGDKP